MASGTANGGTTWFVPSLITIGTTAYDWQEYPAFGLRESDRGGPVSISYQLPLANWYGGACTITQGGTVVTGTRLAATGTVTIDNGLIRLVNHDFAMASGSPLAYGIDLQRHEHLNRDTLLWVAVNFGKHTRLRCGAIPV